MSNLIVEEILDKTRHLWDEAVFIDSDSGLDITQPAERQAYQNGLLYMREAMIPFVCTRLIACQRQRDRLLALCQQSYEILVANRWDRRGTMEGQVLLCQLRGSIAELTGKTIREIQEAAEEKAAKAAIARASNEETTL